MLRARGLSAGGIDAWFSAWDTPAFIAMVLRTVAEELPASLSLLRNNELPAFSMRSIDKGLRMARRLGQRLGGETPVIATPHHDNHAWFSFCASPFAHDDAPVMVAAIDGFGDRGAMTLYVCEGGVLRELYCNDSMFELARRLLCRDFVDPGRLDPAVERRPLYGRRGLGRLRPQQQSVLQAAAADFTSRSGRPGFRQPFAGELAARSSPSPTRRNSFGILGEPIAPEDMWNPDAMLRVEDIKHKEDTQERLDKAAATQMVFEDALIHIIDHLIRRTGSDRLVLTGGTALNAVGSMRLLEHFGEDYYRRVFGRSARLHLWVPPVPNDAGVALGAAFMGAYLAGAKPGAPLEHAFYCGTPPGDAAIRDALARRRRIKWRRSATSSAAGREAIADLMAYVTAQDGIIALYQGAAETGPRALGHRSILANPRNPQTRELLNARVKYREAIRPLAPMMTREAALRWFDLSDGAADADYNAFNYMVLTAQAKPGARERIPAVIHADGTGRLQIVREADRPADLCLSEGAWPPQRRGGRGQYLVQCCGTDRADPGAGGRDAGPGQGHGRRHHGRGGGGCLRHVVSAPGGAGRRLALCAVA